MVYAESRKALDAARVLREIEQGGVVAYTSTLTWDEVVWVTKRLLGRADSLQAGQKLITFPRLRFVPVTEELLSRAQKLVDAYEVGPRDAIHCASATSRNVDSLISDDADLDSVSEIKRLSPGGWAKRGT